MAGGFFHFCFLTYSVAFFSGKGKRNISVIFEKKLLLSGYFLQSRWSLQSETEKYPKKSNDWIDNRIKLVYYKSINITPKEAAYG